MGNSNPYMCSYICRIDLMVPDQNILLIMDQSNEKNPDPQHCHVHMYTIGMLFIYQMVAQYFGVK